MFYSYITFDLIIVYILYPKVITNPPDVISDIPKLLFTPELIDESL